jgi:hypothetical protein
MKKLFLFLISALILTATAFAATIDITPVIAGNNDNLLCNVSENAAAYTYKWFDGDIFIANGQTLDNSLTQRDHTYTCKAFLPPTPYTNEIFIGQASRDVLNSAPTAPTVTLSTGPYNTNSTVSVTATGSTDSDNDALTVNFEFFADGVSTERISGPYGMSTNFPFIFAPGTVMSVNVWTNDGNVDSGIGTASFTVSNYAPVISSLTYAPLFPGYTDTITMSTSATDTDGTSLTYNYQFSNLNDSTIIQAYSTNSSLALNSSFINNTIRATVTVSDGIDSTISFVDIFVNDIPTNATNTTVATFNYCSINSTTSPVSLKEITNDNSINGKKFNPLDEIEIKVKADNSDKDNKKDVVVQAVLVRNGIEIDDTEVDKSMTLNKDDYSTVILNMVIPEDIDEGDYELYVKVYDNDQELNCQEQMLSISVTKSSHEVVFNNVEMPTTALSGSTITIDGKFVNIGKEDEDRVKIVYSDDFGNSFSEERTGLDSGNSMDFSFTAKIPANATAGEYKAKIKLYYDYNSDDKTYGDSSDETTYKINVLESKKEAVTITAGQITTTATSGFELSKWLDENWIFAVVSSIEVIAVIYLISLLKSRI